MLPEVRVLLDAQEIDNEIIELKAQLAKYPVIWEEVKQSLAAKKEAFDRAQKNQERHQKDRRRIEQKIRLFSDDLRHSQAKQSSISTHKEFEALNKQIETLKSKITALQEQGSELIDKTEAIDRAVVQSKHDLEETEAFYKSEKARIREQFNEKKARAADLEADRNKMLAKVDQPTKDIYERLCNRHPGSVAVTVRSRSCTGCHFNLLPDHLVQLHRMEKIVYCPNCGRILSHDENFVPEEHAGAR